MKIMILTSLIFREIGRELNRTVAKLEKLTERKELYVMYSVHVVTVVARNLVPVYYYY